MIHAMEGMEALIPFYERDLIVDEPRVVKSGKEGTVYRCQAHPNTGAEFFAVKLYRPRHRRTFHNDAIYREGRPILDSSGHPRPSWNRASRAKGRMGRAVQYQTWVDHEYRILTRLHGAGADVPRPIARSGGAILMEYIGDSDRPAPALKQVTLSPDEIHPLLVRVLDNIALWLRNNCVHGDLSAFNILYRDGTITIIDFPQAIDPRFNPNARELLLRDLTNIAAFWSRYGVHVDPEPYGEDLCQRFLRADL